ncbi:hypothetical protein ACLKA7_005529 [Drosophila subpalustris]
MAAPTPNAATTERPTFTTEDLVAVWAKMPTACGGQEAVIASDTSRETPMTLTQRGWCPRGVLSTGKSPLDNWL